MSKYTKEQLNAAISSKYDVIGSAICEDLPASSDDEDILFALQSSQSALFFALQANIESLCRSGLADPADAPILLKGAKLLHAATVASIRKQLETVKG